jgi:threonine dehydrogenase-like Zn-dependent dehydrogenase
MDLHRVFWRELRVLGARVYERRDFERAAELVAEGTIPAAELITGIVPLTEVQSAFGVLEAGQAMKLLVEVNAS